ncbi:unnamed protein product, partial [Polarella glacialis]
ASGPHRGVVVCSSMAKPWECSDRMQSWRQRPRGCLPGFKNPGKYVASASRRAQAFSRDD